MTHCLSRSLRQPIELGYCRVLRGNMWGEEENKYDGMKDATNECFRHTQDIVFLGYIWEAPVATMVENGVSGQILTKDTHNSIGLPSSRIAMMMIIWRKCKRARRLGKYWDVGLSDLGSMGHEKSWRKYTGSEKEHAIVKPIVRSPLFIWHHVNQEEHGQQNPAIIRFFRFRDIRYYYYQSPLSFELSFQNASHRTSRLHSLLEG